MNQEHCYELGPDYDPGDRVQAFDLASRSSEQIPLGVIYAETRPAYDQTALAGIKHPLRDLGVDPNLAQKLIDRLR